MLKALLHNQEPGRICEVVTPGNEFEVHENFQWVDVPDDTTLVDKYNPDGTITKFDQTALPGFREYAYQIARGIAYQSPGNQLDMLFHELIATGSISNTGTWATHIAEVKANIPKDDPEAVIAWNQAQVAAFQAAAQTATTISIAS